MAPPPSSQTDILIIRAGPVGLTLAAQLARHGVLGVRLVKRRAGPAAHSNALVVDVRTRDVLDAMGAHGSFTKRGCPAAVASLHAFGRPVADVPSKLSRA